MGPLSIGGGGGGVLVGMVHVRVQEASRNSTSPWTGMLRAVPWTFAGVGNAIFELYVPVRTIGQRNDVRHRSMRGALSARYFSTRGPGCDDEDKRTVTSIEPEIAKSLHNSFSLTVDTTYR
jgi:hypothetical protein